MADGAGLVELHLVGTASTAAGRASLSLPPVAHTPPRSVPCASPSGAALGTLAGTIYIRPAPRPWAHDDGNADCQFDHCSSIIAQPRNSSR